LDWQQWCFEQREQKRERAALIRHQMQAHAWDRPAVGKDGECTRCGCLPCRCGRRIKYRRK
jgi:hypothetical protein